MVTPHFHVPCPEDSQEQCEPTPEQGSQDNVDAWSVNPALQGLW